MPNRIAKLLNVEKPIIQASMYFMTNAELVSAVSNAGGFGILGAAAGQNYYEANIEKNLALMEEEIKKTKSLTSKPFGLTVSPTPFKKENVDTSTGASQSGTDDVNFDTVADLILKYKIGDEVDLSRDKMTNGILKLAKKYGIKALVYSGALIPEWIKKIHENGIKVMYRPLTPEPKIVKEAVKANVDAIIATGFDEGGTVPGKVVGTFATIPMVVDAAEDVPVIAAGAVVDERTTKAAFDLGAEGIYAGTAFLASNEAPMAENIKKQMLHLTAEDMLMYRAPNSFYRSVPGKLADKLVEMDKHGATTDEIWKAAGGYDDLREGMVLGNLDKGVATLGLGVSSIHKIEPAADIVNKMYAGIPIDKR